MPQSEVPVLELRGITKAFPGVLANDHIDLILNRGEILALLGENGAGKSTLMNILYGLYRQDEGTILVNGQSVEINEPGDAIAQGIGMVHQHFMLVPVLTVTENVMLGNESVKNGFLNRRSAANRIREISKQYGLDVDPNAYVKDLPLGIQQRVEIIKLLYRNADILILDEPTAVLTPQEVDELFAIIQTLIDDGKSMIFITHKLNEVMAISDKITVLRRGKVVGHTIPAETSQEDLASMMVGRDVLLKVERGTPKLGRTALKVNNLHVADDLGNPAVEGVSFEVREGEVLGIAGVQGNGQTELVQALTGLRPVEEGNIHILGQDTTRATPRKVLEAGVGHVPEDRQHEGLVLSFPISDNVVLDTYYTEPYAKGGTLQADVILQTARDRVDEYDVRTPDVTPPVDTLSGGNQQKVIVAREFSREIKLLIASQPTRGVDVGSIEFIHRRIIEKRDQGTAVLVVSSELDEVLNLSDRIAVMYEGRIMDILPSTQATKERVGLLMAGVETGAE